MVPLIRRAGARLTYANVVASAALFVALGGTSYAVSRLPKSSVGAAQLRRNAVTSAKVKDRTLLAKDFKNGQLPAGATGTTGAKGDAGAAGATGPIGPTGPSDAYIVSHTSGSFLGGGLSLTTLATLTLPAGEYVVTGQAKLDNGDAVTGAVQCYLLRPDGATIISESTHGLGITTAFDDVQTASLTGTVSLRDLAAITLRCSYDNSGGGSSSISASNRRLVATRVGSLTVQ